MTDVPAYLSFPSPLGPLTVFAEGGRITVLESGRAPREGGGRERGGEGDGGNASVLAEARRQLDAYFDGKLTRFDLPLAAAGTPRQKDIWAEMARIPYGQTRTYGELAKALGSAPRAVGRACGANPIPVIVPCHRVLSAGGKVGGYSFADGPDSKRQLLRLEGLSA